MKNLQIFITQVIQHYATNSICALSFSNKSVLAHFHSLFGVGGISLTNSACFIQDIMLREGSRRATKTFQSCFWDVRTQSSDSPARAVCTSGDIGPWLRQFRLLLASKGERSDGQMPLNIWKGQERHSPSISSSNNQPAPNASGAKEEKPWSRGKEESECSNF